jgi:hypothetical protein
MVAGFTTAYEISAYHHIKYGNCWTLDSNTLVSAAPGHREGNHRQIQSSNDIQRNFVCLFVWRGLTPLSTIFQLYRGGSFESCDRMVAGFTTAYEISAYHH